MGCLLGAGALAAEPDSTVCFEGRAVNGSQQPLPGVKVVLIGTPLSTMTDGTGAFTLAGDAGFLAKSPRSLALEFTAAGCEARTRIHLLNDDIPLFLRSLYLEYASLIRPWEWEADAPARRDTPETADGPAAYEFFEHVNKMACDKTGNRWRRPDANRRLPPGRRGWK